MNSEKSKKEIMGELLEEGLVMLHLDATLPEVSVPERFKQEYALRLNYSYGFRLGDLELRDDAVTASLSFSGAPFFCVVPWKAVWAMSQPKGVKTFLFEESLPSELHHLMSAVMTQWVEESLPGEEDEEEEIGETEEATEKTDEYPPPKLASLQEAEEQQRDEKKPAPRFRVLNGGGRSDSGRPTDGEEQRASPSEEGRQPLSHLKLLD